MILFLHGFGSCGSGNKSALLAQWFGRQQLLAPDLPVDPAETIALAEALIARHPVTLLVGSSLGGYYATWLASRHQLSALLINPSTQPCNTLAGQIGRHRWWCREAEFDWSAEHVAKLSAYRLPQPGGRCLVLLQSGDEVLDYRLAQDYYRDHRVIIEQGGNHRFETLADYRSMIERFHAGS